ncbi:uridine kinase [Actinosynnema sp. ALI-1.44]|uniref:uridine kinase n=1 Tax=Actinosynnema sp. ALI-1.44 TaxID=1933779 RepID=UPI00097CAD98|nr:uridine kinase [Actinosynnema sp. ALI-1.44]ONI70586.1 uridine kinase [Actinosynnema sp. ALI-1.44]
MRFRPVTYAALVDHVVSRITAVPGQVRVAIDGAAAARPGELADALVDPLRVLGRSVVRVRAEDFLRPASLRFEQGKTDEESRYSSWLDEGALRREVLTGDKVLPSLWNARTDRATRADYVALPPEGVVVIDGELLLGRGLPFDVTVHLWLSAGALARRTEPGDAWSLPVLARYDTEADPLTTADVAVRIDDPNHPAMRST